MRPSQTVILGFLAVIAVGTALLTLPVSSKSGGWTFVLDAFFTSASAVCVTGLTVLPTAAHFSWFGQAVILLLVQTGGLGFMTATTFVLLIIRKKISFKNRFGLQDSLTSDTAKGMVRLVRSILIFTFVLELTGALILMPFFILKNGAAGIWQAVFTSVSAFCNAGFDLFSPHGGAGASLTSYSGNAAVCLTVCALVIAGGIGFTVIADAYASRGRLKKLSVHSKVVLTFTAALLLIGTIIFLALEYNNPATLAGRNFFSKLLAAFFQSVTARTAGFYTIEQSALRPASKVVFSLLMFIGAAPGSTGGGIKITTFALLIVTTATVMRGRDHVVLFKHKIGYKNVYKALSVVILGIALIIFLTIFILISEHGNEAIRSAGLYGFNNILFDSVATFSTAGLSTGLTPLLSVPSKLATVFVMFIGRVGLINFGVALFTEKDIALIDYPESNIGIG